MATMRLPLLRDELASAVRAFESATDLQVCVRGVSGIWKDVDGQGLVPRSHAEHRTPFCLAVKAAQLPACRQCDVDDLPSACPPGSLPRVRTCHAGADELLVPLTQHGRLVGVLFVGQFRRADHQPGALSHRDAEAVEQLRQLGRLLQTYAIDVYQRAQARRRVGLDDRRARIEAFLDANLHRNPSLSDLAEHLALSDSRTGHLVRELTGRTYSELKRQWILEAARHLLTHSPAKLADVAAQVGFDDPSYFARVFRRHTGQTPSQYRATHGGDAQRPGV